VQGCDGVAECFRYIRWTCMMTQEVVSSGTMRWMACRVVEGVVTAQCMPPVARRRAVDRITVLPCLFCGEFEGKI
jgi:hypothetical protein